MYAGGHLCSTLGTSHISAGLVANIDLGFELIAKSRVEKTNKNSGICIDSDLKDVSYYVTVLD